MLNLNDLSQLVAFYKYGTLTKVAEEFFISQPTITRTMKRIENEFGVPLFKRTVNRIELNETGIKAAELAEKLINSANEYLSQVRDFDRNLHTIVIESCAPAPLWSLIPELTRKYPAKTISSKLYEDLSQIEENLLNRRCDIAILPHPMDKNGIVCKKYIEEHLSICVPPTHALAGYKEVTTEMINGYNCLLVVRHRILDELSQAKAPCVKTAGADRRVRVQGIGARIDSPMLYHRPRTGLLQRGNERQDDNTYHRPRSKRDLLCAVPHR